MKTFQQPQIWETETHISYELPRNNHYCETCNFHPTELSAEYDPETGEWETYHASGWGGENAFLTTREETIHWLHERWLKHYAHKK